MNPIRIADILIGDDPDLRESAARIHAAESRLHEFRYEPIPRGRDDITCLSWRCRSYAYANLIRAEELLRLGIVAINDGALIGVFLLARALDETLAAVIFANRRIKRLVERRDGAALEEFMAKLLVGNRYMAKKEAGFPEPHGIMTMVDEVDKYLSDIGAGSKKDEHFRTNYDFCSEFVHPSLGSFAAYLRLEGGSTVFSKPAHLERRDLKPLLSQIAVAATLLLDEASVLAETKDLPESWPEIL